MLSFLGIGNSFNSKDGNCSAFYKYNQTMLLIDCGENIFEKILRYELLSDVNTLDVLITHFHTDHIGSLGTLLFYTDKIGIKNVNVAYPNISKLNELINTFGVQECNILLSVPEKLKKYEIISIKQEHALMEAYGYLIKINDKLIYYSGDTKKVPDMILKMFNEDKIDYFYQDVSINKNNYHISLEELENIIPTQKRKNIQCMHIDINMELEQINKSGFTLVKKYRNEE